METGFKYARITLNEPRAIYYAGQVLSGTIECELSQPVNFTTVNVNFFGKAQVKWTEWETEEYNDVRRNKEVTYLANEEYFNFTQIVCGGDGRITQLQQGRQSIPFSYQIPHHAPSSFTGERGEILYTVTAFIDYPDPRMARDELVKSFEVVAPLDLNKDDDVKPSVGLEFEEFYSCCCSQSPMNVVVTLPATGFCPGQAIPVTVTAENDTNVEVKKIVFQLIQKECYRSQEPQSEYYPPEKVLEVMQTGPILSHTKREFTYQLVVPDMIAPHLENCSIIDVGYFFKAIIKLSGCNDDIEDETEISIGLIPLKNLLDPSQYIHPMSQDLPKGPIPEIPANMPNSVSHQQTNFTNNAVPNPHATYPNPVPQFPNPASPYPNAMPFPVVPPYPNSGHLNSAAPYPSQDISPSNVPKDIGFVAPNSNQPSPYPVGQFGYNPSAPSAPPS